jgi:hypothetical protein
MQPLTAANAAASTNADHISTPELSGEADAQVLELMFTLLATCSALMAQLRCDISSALVGLSSAFSM